MPKYRPNESGEEGDFNDVNCRGVERKMDIRGSAIGKDGFEYPYYADKVTSARFFAHTCRPMSG